MHTQVILIEILCRQFRREGRQAAYALEKRSSPFSLGARWVGRGNINALFPKSRQEEMYKSLPEVAALVKPQDAINIRFSNSWINVIRTRQQGSPLHLSFRSYFCHFPHKNAKQ